MDINSLPSSLPNWAFRLYAFNHMTMYSLKRYLRLDVGDEAHAFLKIVMLYNVVIWFFFFLRTRQQFLHYFFGKRHPTLSQEFHAVFGTANRYDRDYLEYRRLYRGYLAFLIFLLFTAFIFLLPQTWVLAFGWHLGQLFALFLPARLLAFN